ncbi:MAG: enoyl-CoA hydratase/isomerase family protein, partial [Proteobacteria bacterium]|nr:enoyl-CoA hydratase/isomerase family protein [Pseudomonadota bacterium]
EIFETCSEMMISIARLRQPVIAQVQGAATAAGCQLVATCDLAICSDEARFATPGVNIGLFCSTPMVALSRAIGRKAAMEMLLLGEMINARRAYEVGLVNRVVPGSDLELEVKKVAKHIASKSGSVLAIGKEAFGRQAELELEQAYGYAAKVMTENMLLRDASEGISAFLDKREPKWCE